MVVRKAKVNNGISIATEADGRGQARCAAIADAGIATGADFAQLMSLLIGDIAMRRIDPGTANAICNAGGKLLQIVEMQRKHGGSASKAEKPADLRLT